MSPAEQPSQNNPGSPKPSASPGVEDAAQQTLSHLEDMTTTLAHEVGVPAEKKSAPRSLMPSPAPAETTENTQDVQPKDTAPAEPAAADEESAPAAADMTVTPDAPDAPSAPGAGSSADAPDGARPAGEAMPPADPPVAGASDDPPADAADGVEPDDEIEQEIQEALGQAPAAGGQGAEAAAPDGGEATPDSPKAAADGEAEPAAPAPRGLLQRIVAILDLILTPVVLILLLIDLPFRRLPAGLRHLLAYAAIATAFMATAIWVYILMAGG